MSVKVAIVGCGTVGRASAEILLQDAAGMTDRTGAEIELAAIVDRNPDQTEGLGIAPHRVFTDLDPVLQDPEIQIVVELVGGTGAARSIVSSALQAGKHVVTANKALLAHHGRELFEIALSNSVTIAFEASCGGGIPIVRALYDGLAANRIDALYGIVNGTCNFILTRMVGDGLSYSDELAEAQDGGLAEADPTLDVNGADSSHKIAILASLAFGSAVQIHQVPTRGIEGVHTTDVQIGGELGYGLKLLAYATREDGGLSLGVEPCFVPQDHPLSWVAGAFNAVSVYGHRTGHTLHYGRGAGGSPTAGAVVADVLALARGIYQPVFTPLVRNAMRHEQLPVLAPGELQSRFYLRFVVPDEAGALAHVAGVLAEEGISISSLFQQEVEEGWDGPVPIIVTTHLTRRSAIQKACARANTRQEPVVLRILDEHEERFG